MPVERFEIVLNNSETPCYSPGDHVKGELVVLNSANVTYEGLLFEFIGHCEALVANAENGLVYNTEETYFHSKRHLNQQADGSSHGELMSGEHRFPFDFHLPHNIPPSYVGDNGKIEYVLKAHMKRPLLKHDQHHEVSLIVRPHVDLIVSSQEPSRTSKTKDHMLFRPGSISASLSTDKKVYVPGETVYVTARIENHTKIAIHKTTLQLVMKETCTTLHGDGKFSEKVLLSLDKGHIDHDDNALWDREPILIPTTMSHGHYLPPTGLPNCNAIDISYEVKLIVHPGPLTADLVESVDIVVVSNVLNK